MAHLGRDLKDHLVPILLLWTRTSFTGSHFSELHIGQWIDR